MRLDHLVGTGLGKRVEAFIANGVASNNIAPLNGALHGLRG